MYLRLSETDPAIGEIAMSIEQKITELPSPAHPVMKRDELLVRMARLERHVARLEEIVYAPTYWQVFVAACKLTLVKVRRWFD
jgi:hypothetical protein